MLVNIMTVLEAAYIPLEMQKAPTVFVMNSQLMLTLCNIYTLMTIAPFVSAPEENRPIFMGMHQLILDIKSEK